MEVLSSGILGVQKTKLSPKRTEKNSDDIEPARKRRLLSADSFSFSFEDITSHLYSKHDLQNVPQEDSLDEYNFCFWCDAKRYQESFQCPYHQNQPHKKKQETKKPYAYQDIPNMLQLYTTNTPNGARTGVRTIMQLPAGAWIGPYEGQLVKKDEAPLKNKFMWEIFQDGKLHGYIDGSDENTSSWMRFIERSNCREEQNLWAFQYQNKIFYRANRTIPPGQELMVWYDQEYTKYANGMSGKTNTVIKKGNQSMTLNFESLASPVRSHQSQMVPDIPNKTTDQTGTIQLETSFNRIGALVSSPTKQTNPAVFAQLSRGKTETTPSKPVPRVSTGFSLKITDSKLTERADDYSSSSPQSPASSDSGCSFGLDSPTKSETNETWRCGQCHKTFSQRSMLQVHVCANTRFKPFKCGHCDKSFTTAGEMRAHAVIHQGKKPFKCGYCARSFTGATTLNNHIRIHTGEKPFKCEKCGKIFSQGSQLSKHEKIPGDCIPRTKLN